jgi:hypothetical protein
MMRKLATVSVCAIILLGGIAASASAKGAGSGGGGAASHGGHAGSSGGHPGGTTVHGPPAGFVYDRTAQPGTRCQPGVCFNP